MAWVRLDDKFPHNPKVLKAGPLGLAMHVAAICYCNQHLTDGFLPRQAAPTLLDFSGIAMNVWDNGVMGGGNDAEWQMVVDDLVRAGLWIESDCGWQLHDYLEYQPSKTQVLQARSQNASRQARWRNGDGNAVTNNATNAVSNAHVTAAPSKNPSKNKKDIEETYPIAFENFWELVPTDRKVSKRQALRAFLAAINRNSPGAIDLGRLFAEHFKAAGRYAQHPATWLNADGWLNAPPTQPQTTEGLHASERAALEAWLKPSRVPNGVWLGPGAPPNDPNNTLPAALKAEYADRISRRSAEIAADAKIKAAGAICAADGMRQSKDATDRSPGVLCSSPIRSIAKVG